MGNWFLDVLVSAMTGIIQGITLLFEKLGLTVYDVISNNLMVNSSTSLGHGNFLDVIGTGRTESTFHAYYQAFWILGWGVFMLLMYAIIIGILSGQNSSIQRDRAKNGAKFVVLSAVLMWVGQPFAVSITQIARDVSMLFLTIGGGNQIHFRMTAFQGNPMDHLFSAFVGFFQALMALILYLLYQFRHLFLLVWTVWFPLAMAFAAHEKTRPLAKLWWTEWVFQMAVPIGQSLVFGVSYAMVGDSTSAAAMTLAEIFTAITGTVGFLMSASYVRKFIDLVAQGYGATSLGYMTGEKLAHGAALGVTAMAGDMAAAHALKVGGAAIGRPVAALAHKVDNTKWMKNTTEASLHGAPEGYARAIHGGAGVDDLMMHHQMAAHGEQDVIQGADGFGTETVQKAMGQTGGRTLGAGAKVGRQSKRGFGGHPVFHSRTADTVKTMAVGVGNAVAHSNLGTSSRAKWNRFQNDGGIQGHVGTMAANVTEKVAPTVGKVTGRFAGAMVEGAALAGGGADLGSASLASEATRDAGVQLGHRVASTARAHVHTKDMQRQRVGQVREEMRAIMRTNALVSRVPNIEPQWDDNIGDFVGLSQNESLFESQQGRFAQELGVHMPATEAETMLDRAKQSWTDGVTMPGLHRLPKPVQDAYFAAQNVSRPALLDTEAKEAVRRGQIPFKRYDDEHSRRKAGAEAFLRDARHAILFQH